MQAEAQDTFVFDAEDLYSFKKFGFPSFGHHHEYLEFNGINDGLYHPQNPLYGTTDSFYVEMMIYVDRKANPEQRFLHMGSKKGEPRMLFETRLSSSTGWYLDTVLADHKNAVFLMAPKFSHPFDTWAKVKMIYQNSRVSTFVNDIREIDQPFEFSGIYEHGLSIGVRQNLISWFHGKIKYLRAGPILNRHPG